MVLRNIAQICFAIGLASAGLLLLVNPFQFQSSPIPALAPNLERIASDELTSVKHQFVVDFIRQSELLGYLHPLSKPEVMTFEQQGEHVLVTAHLEGYDQPLPLILDSGVRSPILQRFLARAIAFEDSIPLDGQDMFGIIPQISLGSARFNRIGAYMVGFSRPGNPIWCLSEHGVLGASLMRHGVWQMNYRTRTLTVANDLDQLLRNTDSQDVGSLHKRIKLPMELRDGRPFIRLGLGQGQTVSAMVDTGWGGSIQLAQQDLPEAVQSIPPKARVQGVFESLEGLHSFEYQVLHIPQLLLGTLTLPDFPVLISGAGQGPSSALIGNDFLRYFVVTFDWPQATLYLEPVDSMEAMYPRLEGYGFQTMVQNQGLRIKGLYWPSPAARSGLRVGDKITTINGHDYSFISSERACEFIRHPVGGRYGGPIAVTVQRNGQSSVHHLSPEIIW
jgi:hypothetical protein